jgi:hypothetical protein
MLAKRVLMYLVEVSMCTHQTEGSFLAVIYLQQQEPTEGQAIPTLPDIRSKRWQ